MEYFWRRKNKNKKEKHTMSNKNNSKKELRKLIKSTQREERVFPKKKTYLFKWQNLLECQSNSGYI